MRKKISEKRLENIALYYLQHYESCSSKLREMLKRRIKKAEIQGCEVSVDANKWIENIISKMQDLGYINDKRYSENTLRRLRNSGKSTRYIYSKLKNDGLKLDLIQSLFDELKETSDDLDLISAKRLVDKKKLGFHRSSENQKLFYQKDLAILGRAGFSYEIACKALKNTSD